MYWWVGTLLGSLSLAVKNAMSRNYDLTACNFILIMIPLTAAGVFYWYGFKNAPKFINCWFLGTAFNSFSAITLGLIFFDKSMTAQTAIGVMSVLFGAYLLIK